MVKPSIVGTSSRPPASTSSWPPPAVCGKPGSDASKRGLSSRMTANARRSCTHRSPRPSLRMLIHFPARGRPTRRIPSPDLPLIRHNPVPQPNHTSFPSRNTPCVSAPSAPEGRASSRKVRAIGVGWSRDHDQTPIRSDEGPGPAVELDCAVAVDAGAVQGHRSETIPVLLVEPGPVPGQHASIRGFAETQNDVAWKTLGRPEPLKVLTVVAEHAVFGSGPHEADPILKQHFDGGVGQPVFRAVVAETVLLGRRGREPG